jgi:tRNA(Ile)-lysidine synthase
MELTARVRRTIRRHELARPGSRVIAALSGGSDSVALTYLLRELHAASDLSLVGLAHFNHQLREAADDDERFCRDLADGLGLPLIVERDDVAARARRERRSVEDAGRAARYEFLERARAHFGADLVALGHTRDDQAETYLLRLLRGAGARGLASMYPRRGTFVRPLLDCRRAELQDYLASRSLPYVVDASNADVSIPRNRVRAELLPLLEGRFNPAVVDALADQAEMARDEWEWMHEAARAASEGICRREGNVWRIDAAGLNALPAALARLVLHRSMTEASGGRPASYGHVNAALRMSGEGGARFDAPGHAVERIGDVLVLTPSRPDRPPPLESFRYDLPIPGRVELAHAGVVVSAERAPSVAAAGAVLGNGVAAVRDELCQAPLAVRNRRPGDRFRPFGLQGRKKLQDYFVDRKVAQSDRDAVPIVVDGADRIVWVAGHTIDHEFRVTDAAQAVLILRLRRV